MRLLILLAFCMGLNAVQSSAQIAGITRDTVINSYERRVGTASQVYNGPEYFYDDRLLNDHAFYINPQAEKGSISYDGVLYNDVDLSYDIVRDVIVTISHDKSYRVKLVPEKLDWFSFRNTKFIKVLPEPADRIPEGFYQLIHNGNSQVLAKRQKKLVDDKSAGTLRYNVSNQSTYYIRKNNRYFPVTDRESVVEAYSDKSAEINNWLKTAEINFRLDKESALIAIASYYDQITAK